MKAAGNRHERTVVQVESKLEDNRGRCTFFRRYVNSHSGEQRRTIYHSLCSSIFSSLNFPIVISYRICIPLLSKPSQTVSTRLDVFRLDATIFQWGSRRREPRKIENRGGRWRGRGPGAVLKKERGETIHRGKRNGVPLSSSTNTPRARRKKAGKEEWENDGGGGGRHLILHFSFGPYTLRMMKRISGCSRESRCTPSRITGHREQVQLGANSANSVLHWTFGAVSKNEDSLSSLSSSFVRNI